MSQQPHQKPGEDVNEFTTQSIQEKDPSLNHFVKADYDNAMDSLNAKASDTA